MTTDAMFHPDDPLSPPEPAFAEPWHAQALALADALVRAGHVSPAQWADTLGVALQRAAASGAPDTPDTYYGAVLAALETVGETLVGIDPTTRAERKAAWEDAYTTTPHGQPVLLPGTAPGA